MKSLFTLAALAGVFVGARHFVIFMNEKSKNRLMARKLAVWESEGGAVPLSSTRAAAQVRPQKPSSLSPPGAG